MKEQETLYLPIKQTFFDQIIAGTKKEEIRDITPTTYKKYLDCDEDGNPWIDDEILDESDLSFYDADLLIACKNGKFPFYFREDIKYLNLAVGYSKERDTALVEVIKITSTIGKDKKGNPARFDFNVEGEVIPNVNGKFCLWQAVFHLGKIIEVHRKINEISTKRNI